MALEGGDRGQRVVLALGVPDVRESLLRTRVSRLRQRPEHVGDLVKPAPLRSSLWKHLGQRGPEAERAVPDGEHRSGHAAPGAIAQQVGPGFGRFAVAVGEGDEFLTAVGAHPDQHQQAESVLLQADVDVNAISPQIDIVDTGQVTGSEGTLLGLPLLGELGDDRRRQPVAGAEELTQRGHEVAGGQAMQVEQRQHLGDGRALTAPRRQDGRGEAPALPNRLVDALVVDAWGVHLDCARAGQHLPGLVIAVAHDQAPADLVTLVGEGGDVGVDLGLERFGEHPAGALAHQLVDERGRRGGSDGGVVAVSGVRDYGEHGCAFPADVGASVMLGGIT
ncbi:hypothetical protein GCM10023334_037540 [Nonomuraea thailandensis]